MNEAYNASTKALNTIRGRAMESLLRLELYKASLRREELGEDATPIFDDWAKEIISDKLDQTMDSSLGVRSVIGQFVPRLMYLDKDWTLENLPQIFPASEFLSIYWLAAWSGYVGLADVWKAIFPALISNYQRAINELPYGIENPYIRIDHALASHILKAYLMELIQLDSDDELIKNFFERADATISVPMDLFG